MKTNSKLYNPYQISRMSDAEIRAAYSRLRSVANKRLSRLQQQNLGMTARTGYRFPTIKQVEESSKATIASELADVSKFLKDERTTVSGEKKFLKNFQEILEEKGFGELADTPDKIYETLSFMDEVRDLHKEMQLPPSDILKMLKEGERLDVPKEKLIDNIEFFLSHLEDLEKVQPSKGGRTFSQKRINSLIKKWEK